ncbi:acyl-CoA dehydrogenase family protein [Actinoplanes sp. NPDC049596]|uniref:acyl-CoA dehydrogenase family protein n=1 Tax=unclassified Actinoplanes TaxID=2626549 RepID=UPI00343BC0B5
MTTMQEMPELLRPAIEKYRDEAEALGRLPEELVRELIAHGAFRLTTPRELGGFEASTAEVLDVLSRVARIDGPTAWILWNLNMGFISGLLPESRVREVWAPGRDPVIAHSGQPGRLIAADGGFTLSGRWKIVSGAHLAEWFLLAGMLTEPAGPGRDAGRYFCLIPRSSVTVQDTWDVVGMRASDSNAVVAEEVFVPQDSVFSFATPNRFADRPAYRLPTVHLLYPGGAAVLIGMAQGAVDELAALATTKTTMSGGTLAATEAVQDALGRATVQVAAARGLLLASVTELAAQDEPTDELRAALRGSIAHVAETARTVLTAMYTAGGSDPLYTPSRLGRIFRDGMAAAQSANLSAAQFALRGRILLGEPPAVPFI